MKNLGLIRYAVTIGAASAMLTACGGSQGPVGALSATRPSSLEVQHPENGEAKGQVKLLYGFTDSPDGAEPYSGVVALTKREAPPPSPRLIGTTLMGGDSNNDGTVYGLTAGEKGSWTESVLYSLKGVSIGDGSEPTGIFFNPKEYQFLVTTVGGGTYGAGTLIALAPNGSGPWTESFLYSFGFPPDGAGPYGAVIADKAGNLFGTTSAGGANGAGTVYRMQPKGSSYTESVLYSFKSGTDGANPHAGLIIDEKGALYGTTVGGGSSSFGTVFKLTPSGSAYKESILYSFQGPPNDGAEPYGGLTVVGKLPLTANGKVIGMSSSGGNKGFGILYELTPSGSSYKESVLWNFGSVSGDGAHPYGGVVVNKKGVIYGTTTSGGSGGSSGLGTFFTLTPSGSTYKESVYSFTGANGATPYAGLSIDSQGHGYLTTAAGGKKGHGVIGIAAGSDF